MALEGHGHGRTRSVTVEQRFERSTRVTTPQPATSTDDLAETARTSLGQTLRCWRYTIEDCTVLAVAGDIDESSSTAFRQELEAAAAERSGHRIVVDLTGVTFLGCSGIGELVQAVRRAHWSPGSLCLTGARESVRRVLDITQVGTVCPVFDSLDQAVAGRR
jgi:anti-anti-sigma factor